MKKSTQKMTRTISEKTQKSKTKTPKITNKKITHNLRTDKTKIQNFQNYTIIQELQGGGEAEIYLIENQNQKQILKLYHKGFSPKLEVMKKIQKLSQQFPEYLIQIFHSGYDTDWDRYYEILEYVPTGTLEDYIQQKKFQNDLNQIRQFIIHSTKALHCLHQNGIIHRDLKPTNILIKNENPLQIILSDFGISSFLVSNISRKLTNVAFSYYYVAPESLSGIIGKEVDYWSLGMILYELLYGKHPFEGLSPEQIIYEITTKGVSIVKEIPSFYLDILKGLLTRNPKKRWGYEEIQQWLDGKEVPVYYEETPIDTYKIPYKFQNQKYFDLKTLILDFLKTENNFQLALEHFERGYILQWLQKNEDYDMFIQLETELRTFSTREEKFIYFCYYHIGNMLPFSLYGKKIDFELIVELLSKFVLDKTLNSFEVHIFQLIQKQMLGKIYYAYTKTSSQEDIFFKCFLNLLDRIYPIKKPAIINIIHLSWITYCIEMKQYIVPDSYINFNFIRNEIKNIETIVISILPEEWIEIKKVKAIQKLKKRYLIPEEIDEMLKTQTYNEKNYHQFSEFIQQALSHPENILLTKKDKKIIKDLLNSSYWLPSELYSLYQKYKDNFSSLSIPQYFQFVFMYQWSLKNKKFLIKKSEFHIPFPFSLYQEWIHSQFSLEELKKDPFLFFRKGIGSGNPDWVVISLETSKQYKKNKWKQWLYGNFYRPFDFDYSIFILEYFNLEVYKILLEKLGPIRFSEFSQLKEKIKNKTSQEIIEQIKQALWIFYEYYPELAKEYDRNASFKIYKKIPFKQFENPTSHKNNIRDSSKNKNIEFRDLGASSQKRIIDAFNDLSQKFKEY